jgi:hypothetical protein
MVGVGNACNLDEAFAQRALHRCRFLLPSAQPQVLTSFAVSLLLVFRTNQSYDRWWEARKVWGAVLNRARDIVNQCVVFFPPEEKRLQHACARWTWAFTRTLQAHLQVCYARFLCVFASCTCSLFGTVLLIPDAT